MGKFNVCIYARQEQISAFDCVSLKLNSRVASIGFLKHVTISCVIKSGSCHTKAGNSKGRVLNDTHRLAELCSDSPIYIQLSA